MFAIGMMSGPALANESGIEGVILIGPVHGGPVRLGVPNSRPLANAGFVVRKGETELASFTTDEQGRLRVILVPGRYAVATKRKGKLGSCGPFEVEVVSGQMVQVQWGCDSGMR